MSTTPAKHTHQLLLLTFILFFSLVLGAPAHSQQRPARPSSRPKPQKLSSHVVLISIEGLRSDYIVNPDAYKLRIPNLRAWKAGGAYAQGVESVYPSLSYPAHT